MKEFDVMVTYKGKPTWIGNVQAATLKKADKLAKQMFGPSVWAEE